MKTLFIVLFIFGITFISYAKEKQKEPKGIIGETIENDNSVIWKFVDEQPSKVIKKKFTWLTVISWKYDGKSHNGMPKPEINKKMIKLENSIEDLIIKKICIHAYSRTGNNLKELVYYITDRDKFIKSFNFALKDQEKYPITIDFYEDKEWKDFTTIQQKFDKTKTK